MSLIVSLFVAFLASLVTAVVLIATQHLHGHLSHDSQAGVQKLHSTPVPRIGGLALLAGQLAGGLVLPETMRALWWTVCLAAAPAFLAGLAEDVTKRVGVRWRLGATILAGLVFAAATGYALDRVDLPGADWLLSFKWFAIPFTAFAIGGIANALNIIDGVNGLASGTAIIVLSGFAVVAAQCGDGEMLALCLVAIGALAGFFALNFPLGRIFLGDAGAYSTGFLLAVVAVMLPERNPELSPLIGLLALAYPVIETMVSIHRRLVRKGTNPGQPDRLHLHSLVYRHRARRLAQLVGLPHLRNAMTSVLLWSLSLIAVAIMVIGRNHSDIILAGLLVPLGLYVVFYRRVALLRPLSARAAKTAPGT
jgi:UDP-N-acetylmuramyl pentapeptide phosphotransferase/UDP-N-acetylglucosamine-1-phosphate transferase